MLLNNKEINMWLKSSHLHMIYSESSIVQIFTLLPAVFCININEYHITANGFTYFQPTTCNYGLRCSKTSVWYLLHFLNVKFRHSVVLRQRPYKRVFGYAMCSGLHFSSFLVASSGKKKAHKIFSIRMAKWPMMIRDFVEPKEL